MLIRFVAACLALLLHLSAYADTVIKFPFDPRISPNGDRVVFSWNGDLWDATIRGGEARKLTAHPADDRQPVFSRDGSQIAFISNRTGSNQIYVMSARGGNAQQITNHTEGYEVHDWFPDGKSLLCTGQRDHHWRDASRLIRVWVDGSRGEQVLVDAAAKSPSLSPDGKRILLNREGGRWYRKGYQGAKAAQVWMLELDSGTFVKLLDEGVDCYWPVWAADGSSFFYSQGGVEGFDLWQATFTDEDENAITTERVLDVDTHAVTFPSVATGSTQVVYRHGFDLYRWNSEGGGSAKKLKLRAKRGAELEEDRTRRRLERATEVAFQDDGLEIAFIAGGDVWVMDTELREPVQVTNTPGHESDLIWGPDGESLWFVSSPKNQPDIYRVVRADDEQYWWQNSEFALKQMTDDRLTESRLKLDPTGQRLFYVRGNGELWSMDLTSNESTKHLKGFSKPEFDVSRDGRWLAYAQDDDDFNGDIFVVPVDGSRPPYNISRHPDNDANPRFSPDGEVLAFTSRRFEDESDICYVYLQNELADQTERDRKLKSALKKMEEQRKAAAKKEPAPSSEGQELKDKKDDAEATEPEEEVDEEEEELAEDLVEIDLNGIEERVRRIRLPNVDERRLVWVGDSQQLAFAANIKGKSGLYSVELPDETEPKLISSTTGSGVVWSSKAKSLFLNADGEPTKLDLNGKVESYAISVVQEYSRSERLANGFDVAWRTMRDRWYDERVGGKNWDQIRRRYRQMAADSVDSQTFDLVIEMMLGELNGSHLGFYPSNDDGYRAPPHPDRTAHLGIRFVADHKGPGLKVRDIIPDGPADRHGVSIAPGDIILQIDGTPVDPAMDLTTILNGLPERDMHLKVRQQIDGEESDQEFTIRPSSYSRIRSRLYQKWEADTRAKVTRQSDGKLGYLHIRSMNMESFNEFERQLYATGSGKEGMVIDVRDNGGGWTTDYLLTALTQPRHAVTVPRDGGPGYPQDRKVFASWHKPIVVLCNQNSFSNAEIFSHAIKSLGRGKLVGVPTAGGVISTGSAQVTDVGRIRLPFRGWFVLNTGQDMELNGAVPDVVVWPKPGEIPTGIDRQLERAVKILLKEVAAQSTAPRLRYATERN